MTAALVVRPSSLGDIVHALALAADVRAARPELALDWVAEDAFAALPTLCADVRTVIPVALRRWRSALAHGATWREFGAFRAALRHERYAAVLDLQEQLKGAMIARIARGPRHGLHAATIREPVATLLHDVHHKLPRDVHFITKARALAAAAFGYEVAGPPRWRWRLPAPPATLPARPFVVLISATSRASKLWPEPSWRALAQRFADADFDVLLLSGTPAEAERASRIAAGIPATTVLGRTPLADLAALLARAEYVVGVDTGLTHLAAALGTLTVAVFTDTDATLAGVAIDGPHAVDVGGLGTVPSFAAVDDALGSLARRHPAC
ncbi:MAG: lipopolysaccharide heptosyltransferase I [Proteobacteria bacterium]|nr:lipopolysaccharide heptosyltransferase I [Pseudomonadota bacterium]